MTKSPPGLWLVHDDGIYLMSNGHPGLLVDEAGPRHFVVYALGYDPKSDPDVWERSRDAVGGDDFCYFIKADSPQGFFPPGHDHLEIEVKHNKTYILEISCFTSRGGYVLAEGRGPHA